MRAGPDDVDLSIGAQRLVAFLALHEKRLQRRYVAARLWMDVSNDRANANLRTAVYRIQRTGLPILECSSSQVALHREVAVDIREATRYARAVLEQAPPTSLRGWRILAADLIPDWYEDWVEVERERYRQLRLDALEQVCEQLTVARRFGEAVQAGLFATAADPTRESAERVLIGAFLAHGNVAAAVRHYDRFHSMMLSELGVAPSAELSGLLQSALDSADRDAAVPGDHARRSAKL
jgi:DNA-binding SARP family transcriptional activator